MRHFLILVVTAAVMLQWVMVTSNAVNIPSGMDFDLFLGFLNSWLGETDLNSRLRLLFEPGEALYRTFSRVVSLLSYYTLGSINFYLLVLLGNLFLIFSYLLMVFGSNPKDSKCLSMYLVTPLLVFHPQYSDLSMWASGATTEIAVIFLSLISFFLARYPSLLATTFSLVCGLVASLSAVSGCFTILILGILYLIQKRRKLGLFVALLGLFLLFLCLEYVVDIRSLQIQPLPYLSYLMSYFGGVVSLRFETSIFYGAAFLTGFFCLIGPLSVSKPFLFAGLLFLFCCGVIQGALEPQLEVESAYYETRYRLVSSFFLAFLWLGIVSLLNTKSLVRNISFVAFMAGILFSGLSYNRFGPNYALRRTILSDSAVRYQVTDFGLLYFDHLRARNIALEATRNSIFSFPETDISKLEQKVVPERLKVKRAKMVYGFEHLIVSAKHVFFDGYAFLSAMNQADTRTLIRLKGKNRKTYSLPLELRKRPDIAEKYRRSDVVESGFFGVLDRSHIPDGAYRVFILIRKKGANYYSDTGHVLYLSKQSLV